MCRISYEKCICFIFLVILAVLSCSGFRIDNLAMTDIISNKRNSHTSNSLLYNSAAAEIERLAGGEDQHQRHRIRHHRQLRPQQPTSSQPSERLAQVRPTDLLRRPSPTRPLAQRSRNRRQRQQQQCPDHDITWKVFKSSTIVVAKVESMSMNRSAAQNYTVNFKVLHRLKNSTIPVDDKLTLKFINKTSSASSSTCTEYNNDFFARSSHHRGRSHQSLVRTQKEIEQSKEYILFLNTTSPHRFAATFEPEKIEKRRKKREREKEIMKIIHRFSSPSYTPNPLSFEKLNQSTNVTKKRLRIVCKIKGPAPIPIIHWEHSNKLLHPNNRTRIIQKKRRSTLVIKNPVRGDSGNYRCSARGVDGNEASIEHDIITSEKFDPYAKNKVPCDLRIANHFCDNGGTCFFEESMGENFCHCRENFTGNRCEEKKASNQSSMYAKKPLYTTCKLGIYTNYDNC